jgi:hypothetical protein
MIVTPPAGWVREPLTGSTSAAAGEVIAQWLSYDRGREEYIEVARGTSIGFSSDNFAEYYRVRLTRGDNRVLALKKIRLCNGESGWYVKSRNTLYPNEDTHEEVFFVDGKYAYFASYHYPPALAPLPSAERAIASLCVPKPVVTKPLVLPVAFSPPPGYLISNPRLVTFPVEPSAFALFFNPTHPNDTLMLLREGMPDKKPTADELAQEKATENELKREHVKVKLLSATLPAVETLCDDNTGIVFNFNVSAGLYKYAYEYMMLIGPDAAYSAVYIRPESMLKYAPASQALRTLCPLEPSPPPSPSLSPSPLSSPSPAPSPTVSPSRSV